MVPERDMFRVHPGRRMFDLTLPNTTAKHNEKRPVSMNIGTGLLEKIGVIERELYEFPFFIDIDRQYPL
jgi:hypothetical protein